MSLHLPFERFVRTGEFAASPSLLETVGLWAGAILISFVLSLALDRLPFSLQKQIHRVTIPGANALAYFMPSILYSRLAPHRPATYYRMRSGVALNDSTANWDLTVLIVLDVSAEEVLFRGLPLWIALTIGVSPAVPVLVGTAYLVGSTGRVRRLPLDIVLAWLWLTGAGLLAVMLSAGTILIFHLLLRFTDWHPRQQRQQSTTAR